MMWWPNKSFKSEITTEFWNNETQVKWNQATKLWKCDGGGFTTSKTGMVIITIITILSKAHKISRKTKVCVSERANAPREIFRLLQKYKVSQMGRKT